MANPTDDDTAESTTAIVRTPSVSALPKPSDDYVVLARNPEEMALAQTQLLIWAEQKVASEEALLKEAQDNLEHAVRTKIRTVGWKRQADFLAKRVVYYSKMRDAIRAGYSIIPDFPINVIAVRTKRKAPPSKVRKGGAWRNVPDIQAQSLPTGEGRYVSPTPYVREWKTPEKRKLHDGREEAYNQTWVQASEFEEEIDFPFTTVRPQILSELTTAMKALIFDEIGVLPAPRNPDPMVVGTILLKKGGFSETRLSFLITWWIDTRTL